MIDLTAIAGRNASAIASIRDVIYRRGDEALTEDDKDQIVLLAQSMASNTDLPIKEIP